MFSQFARKLLFSRKIMKRMYNILQLFTHPFPQFIHDFRECSPNSLVGKGIYDFVFLWPTTILPRNASLGSSRRRKMVKACSPIIFHYR